MPCLPGVDRLKLLDTPKKKRMLAPLFYSQPGDQIFVPKVAHPGEDAGADIRAHVKEHPSDANRLRALARLSEQSKQSTGLYFDGESVEVRDQYDAEELSARTIGFVTLAPGQTALINAGFKMSMPKTHDGLGYPWSACVPVYQIVSRSGLACKHGIVVTNAPGIIDSGYRDWIKVSLTNRGSGYHVFSHGARIAQGLYSFVYDQSYAKVVDDESLLGESVRASGGFGSTKVS